MSCASFASCSMTGMIGVSPGRSSKPACSSPARKRADEAHQVRAAVVGGLGDVDRLQRAGGERGRERVGEEIGPRPLAQQVDDGLRRGHEAAHAAAERLAERAGDDLHALARAGQRRRAAALLAEMPVGVAVVDHDEGAVALGEVADLRQLGDVAVHGEDAVGGDQLEAGAVARRPPSAAPPARSCRNWRSGSASPCTAGCRR